MGGLPGGCGLPGRRRQRGHLARLQVNPAIFLPHNDNHTPYPCHVLSKSVDVTRARRNSRCEPESTTQPCPREYTQFAAVPKAGGTPLVPRERRVVVAGYLVVAGITLATVFVVLFPDPRVRTGTAGLLLGVGWWLYVARSRSRLRLAGQALCDPLTGLYNRRYLNDRLGEEVARVSRYGGVLTVAVVDLDDFKALNDRHGHLRGDEALRAFAIGVRTVLRKSDIAFRFGGEEFVLAFPDTPLVAAGAVLSRLREQTTHPFSAGLAECPEQASDTMALLRLADARLGAAKRAGKAQINAG